MFMPVPHVRIPTTSELLAQHQNYYKDTSSLTFHITSFLIAAIPTFFTLFLNWIDFLESNKIDSEMVEFAGFVIAFAIAMVVGVFAAIWWLKKQKTWWSTAYLKTLRTTINGWATNYHMSQEFAFENYQILQDALKWQNKTEDPWWIPISEKMRKLYELEKNSRDMRQAMRDSRELIVELEKQLEIVRKAHVALYGVDTVPFRPALLAELISVRVKFGSDMTDGLD